MPGRVGKDTKLMRQYRHWLAKEREAHACAEKVADEYLRLTGVPIDTAVRLAEERAEQFGWTD